MSRIEEILTGIRPEFNFSDSEDFIGDGMLDSYDILMLVANWTRAMEYPSRAWISCPKTCATSHPSKSC